MLHHKLYPKPSHLGTKCDWIIKLYKLIYQHKKLQDSLSYINGTTFFNRCLVTNKFKYYTKNKTMYKPNTGCGIKGILQSNFQDLL